MHYIEKSGTTFEITNFPWDENGYKPKTSVTIGYDDGGFKLHFESYDPDLRAVMTEHNTMVCTDSCMEMFMMFSPETDKHYINIEVNPNGAAFSGICLDRDVSSTIDPEYINTLNIKTKVLDDHWEVDYYLPVEYIQKFIPSYKHAEGNVIKGNFYKCAEDNKYPHFGCFNYIEWDHPDFHRPEFFAEFKLV